MLDGERLTSSEGKTLGTEHYVAPELQGGGRRVPDARSDIYSLGKTLYATVAGEHCPREAFREPEWELSGRFGDRRFEHLSGIIERMSAHNPDHRFVSMAECRDQLKRAVENIRRDIPFLPGMYGGPQIPVERFIEMERSLGGAQTDLQRQDALLAALRGSFESAEQHVRATHEGLGETARSSDPNAGDEIVASVCGEHLLAGGALLVAHGAEDLFTEWHSRTLQLVMQDQHTRPQLILAAAGLYALYGVAGLAWSRRRWGPLGLVVRGMASHPERHVYPFLMDNGNAVTTASWLVDNLSQSQVLQRLERGLPATMERMVGLTSGLAAIRWLAGVDDAQLGKIVGAAFRDAQIGFPHYPALYERFFPWVEDVATACLSSADVEIGLGQSIPGQPRSGVAGTCADMTPALACLMSMNHRGQPIDWSFDIDKGGKWAEWMEARFPKVMNNKVITR